MALIKYYKATPISTKNKTKSFVGLLPKGYYLINIPILRSKHVMFWASLLINLSTSNNKIGEKTLFQRSRSMG